jgi:hypothetical protein
MVDKKTLFCIDRARIQFERFEDETVIINVENGLYYSLSPSGSEVLRLVDNGCSVGTLVERLLGNSEEASQHGPRIICFVEDLIREGILVEVDALAVADHTNPIPEPVCSTAGVFQPPLLEKYDEVRDLLLIDPIHMVDQSKGWPKI